MKKTITFLFLVLSLGNLHAHDIFQDFKGKTIFYKITSASELAVTFKDNDYSGLAYTGSIEIPSSINYAGINYIVTSIADFTFSSSTITDIKLPVGIQSIGINAFYGCNQITSISIPEGVKKVNTQAFRGCEAVTSIVLPSTLELIGSGAFSNCMKVTSIKTKAKTPPSFVDQNFNPFNNCGALVGGTTLFVPKGYTNAYSSLTYWNGFKSIVEFNYYDLLFSNGLGLLWSGTVSDAQKVIIAKIVNNMVKVEGGSFYMGAQSTNSGGFNYDTDANADEGPVHYVTLSGFYICKYELSQEEWASIIGSNPSVFASNAKLPVDNVSWDTIQIFTKALKNMTGIDFRLPSEAEWEFSAKGGNQSNGYKYSGSNNLTSIAWWSTFENGIWVGDKTHVVGTKGSNELGIYDMSGNVREWCNDLYGSYSSGSQTNPTGSGSGYQKVIRGGDYNGVASLQRNTWRYSTMSKVSYQKWGFRLANNIISGVIDYKELYSRLNLTGIKNTIRPYPNPTSTVINIDLIDDIESGSLKIYNSMGQKFYEMRESDNHIQIDVSRYPSGLYFIQTTDQNHRVTNIGRFIRE